MKTYKLIIELSDSILDKMASIEEAAKKSDSEFALAAVMATMALKKKFEKEDSFTVNMDAVVDDAELYLLNQAVVCAGAAGLAQEVRIKKKRTRTKDFKV